MIKWLDNVDVALNALAHNMEEEGMMILAYDGETFGHHQKKADKWAEYFPEGVRKREDMKMSTMAEHLKQFEVKGRGQISEKSSWSCYHNLQRWDFCG